MWRRRIFLQWETFFFDNSRKRVARYAKRDSRYRYEKNRIGELLRSVPKKRFFVHTILLTLCSFPFCDKPWEPRDDVLVFETDLADAGSTLRRFFQAHLSTHINNLVFHPASIQRILERGMYMYIYNTYIFFKYIHTHTHIHTFTFAQFLSTSAQCTLAIRLFENIERMYVYNTSDLAT